LFFLNLLDQAVELIVVKAHGMLTVARFVARDVPIGHPAELLASGCLQHNQERIEGNLFFSLSELGLQLIGQVSGGHFEVSVAGAQLKVEAHVQLACALADRAIFRSRFREIVESFEQLVVRRKFLMTLSAVKILSGHENLFQPWTRSGRAS
jgi:hypothetical protein